MATRHVKLAPYSAASSSSDPNQVFGYAWRFNEEKGNQVHPVIPENLLARVYYPKSPLHQPILTPSQIPQNITPQQAATVPTNLVTVFHTCVSVLGLSLPWPKPASYTPSAPASPILIWGGGSSAGQYTIQVLRHYGYTNLVVVASSKHRADLTSLGATSVYDYNYPDVVDKLAAQVGLIPRFIDCIGSSTASVAPIARLAKTGSKVAVLLPVILPKPTPGSPPGYTFDAQASAAWADGVQVSGVRTHNYLDNEALAKLLQPEMMPELLGSGAVRPNRYRVVEGANMLERAQRAMDLMRAGVSGEKLVCRVGEGGRE